MHSMRSDQRQVELRRLGNQIPVLGKDNSLCKIVCVLACLFRRGRARVKDIPGYRCSGKIGVASRRCTTVSVAPPGGGEKSCFLRFFVRCVPLFRSLMLTPILYNERHYSKQM